MRYDGQIEILKSIIILEQRNRPLQSILNVMFHERQGFRRLGCQSN